MVVKKVKRIPVECVVRGYLAGSAWAEYQETGSVSGMELHKAAIIAARANRMAGKLAEATPATKVRQVTAQFPSVFKRHLSNGLEFAIWKE